MLDSKFHNHPSPPLPRFLAPSVKSRIMCSPPGAPLSQPPEADKPKEPKSRTGKLPNATQRNANATGDSQGRNTERHSPIWQRHQGSSQFEMS